MALRGGRRQVLVGRIGVDIVPGVGEVPVDLIVGTVLSYDVQDVLDRRLAGVGGVGHGVVPAAELAARLLDGPRNEGTVRGEVLGALRIAVLALMRANPETA